MRWAIIQIPSMAIDGIEWSLSTGTQSKSGPFTYILFHHAPIKNQNGYDSVVSRMQISMSKLFIFCYLSEVKAINNK